MLGLVGTRDVHADVLCLFLGEFGDLTAQGLDVDAGHLLVEDLGQAVHLVAVLVAVLKQLDLGDGLVVDMTKLG